MRAIILAAGLGTRLKPFTDKQPKCLTEVNGKPILVNMLENLEKAGIKNTDIVIGYLGDTIKNKIGKRFSSININYIENPIYDKTNSSYSLWLAVKNLNEDILFLEGDVFFEEAILKELMSNPNDSTIVEKYNPELDGSFVEIKNNLVSDWIHKSRRKEDFTKEDKFKTVNIHKFSKNFLNTYLLPILAKHTEEKKGVEPIEYIMEDIVKNHAKIEAIEVGNKKWVEIDDANDLKIAETTFKKPTIDEIRSTHGGYWRSNHIDFHYLFNHHFPSPEMYEELSAKMSQIGNYYPSNQKVLAKLMSKWKDEEYFNADNLVIGNGSSELIKYLNDHVITKVTIPLPTFNEFVRLPDEKINKYMLKEDEKFVLNADKLIEEIKRSNSKFAVIINPNNPVGNLTSLQDIEKILKTGVILIIDEAFMSFAGKQYSAEQLIPKYKNLVILASCTKSIGIAGLRLAYLLTENEEVKEKLRNHLPIWNINSLAEYVIEIFPKYKKEHAQSIIESMDDTKWLFDNLLSISYLEPFPTHANAVFCKVNGSARKLAEILYDKYNLMVKEGLNQKDFKTDSYVRLGVRNKQDNQKLLDALREIKKEDIAQSN